MPNMFRFYEWLLARQSRTKINLYLTRGWEYMVE
jgi:hypothetical protein